MRKFMEVGGLIAAVVLIAFGVGAVVLGSQGRSTVASSLTQQKIAGTPDMTPAAIKAEAAKAGLNVATLPIPNCSVANRAITTGSDARCFAQYMQIHALEQSGGLYYSQMPRFATADGRGTNNPAVALTAKGKPQDNPARNVWIQETALTTALNSSYMADQTGLFGIVVGVALILSGIGFAVLSLGGTLTNAEDGLGLLARRRQVATTEPTPSAA